MSDPAPYLYESEYVRVTHAGEIALPCDVDATAPAEPFTRYYPGTPRAARRRDEWDVRRALWLQGLHIQEVKHIKVAGDKGRQKSGTEFWVRPCRTEDEQRVVSERIAEQVNVWIAARLSAPEAQARVGQAMRALEDANGTT